MYNANIYAYKHDAQQLTGGAWRALPAVPAAQCHAGNICSTGKQKQLFFCNYSKIIMIHTQTKKLYKKKIQTETTEKH